MNKKDLLKIGVILTIFAFIFLTTFILYNFNKQPEYIEPEEEVPFNMEIVTDYNTFFSVINNLNKYLNYSIDSNKTAAYYTLSDAYKKKNNITLSNINLKLPYYEYNNISIKATKMYQKNYDNNKLFYVKANYYSSSFEEEKLISENVLYLVLMDYSNMAFAVYPIENNLNELPYQEQTIDISPNDYNGINGSNFITNNFICNLYYSDFLNKLTISPSTTYQLLNNTFREKNYINSNEYTTYIAKNINKISSQISSCTLIQSNPRTYEIKDLNSNIFTFTETTIMNYKVEFKIK